MRVVVNIPIPTATTNSALRSITPTTVPTATDSRSAIDDMVNARSSLISSRISKTRDGLLPIEIIGPFEKEKRVEKHLEKG